MFSIWKSPSVGAGMLLVALCPSVARADAQQFDTVEFQAARSEGRSIVVEVSAPWCTVCHTQRQILLKLLSQERFRDLILFEIDFDTQKEALREVRVRVQSTLISYKGNTEVARTVGDTFPHSLERLFEKALHSD